MHQHPGATFMLPGPGATVAYRATLPGNITGQYYREHAAILGRSNIHCVPKKVTPKFKSL